MAEPRSADLVLEGGGVKGIALVGAISAIEAAGWRIRRVAGTSAGSIVGAFLAAGMTTDQIREVMWSVDYTRFADNTGLDRVPVIGPALSVVFEHGLHSGSYLHDWVEGELRNAGVDTFADLADDDPGSALPADQRYRLTAYASDVSHGRLVRLPSDYRYLYGLDPAEQSVVDAVRASASIPFYFRYVKVQPHHGHDAVLVDGGMLSNFPVDAFDRPPGTGPPRWPTIGIKLSSRQPPDALRYHVEGDLSLIEAMIGTLTSWYDQQHLDDPATVARTIFVDTFGVSSTNFALGEADRRRLYDSGRRAAETWLTANPNAVASSAPTASGRDGRT